MKNSSGRVGESCHLHKYITTMLFTKSQQWRQDHSSQIKFRLFSPDRFSHSATKWTSPAASCLLTRDHRRNQVCSEARGLCSPAHPSFTHTEIKASSPAPRLCALNTIPSKGNQFSSGKEWITGQGGNVRDELEAESRHRLLGLGKDLGAALKRLPQAATAGQRQHP